MGGTCRGSYEGAEYVGKYVYEAIIRIAYIVERTNTFHDVYLECLLRCATQQPAIQCNVHTLPRDHLRNTLGDFCSSHSCRVVPETINETTPGNSRGFRLFETYSTASGFGTLPDVNALPAFRSIFRSLPCPSKISVVGAQSPMNVNIITTSHNGIM